MSIKDRLSAEMKDAMKARDSVKVSTIRMILSSVKYKEIEKGGPLDDDVMVSVLATAAKQRREAIEQYKKGGRDDLAEKESAELGVIESFMPKQMPADEVEAVVIKAIADTGASGPRDMGKVMKELMGQLKGKADGKLINELVKKHLGG
jgi:uncharacterized protein